MKCKINPTPSTISNFDKQNYIGTMIINAVTGKNLEGIYGSLQRECYCANQNQKNKIQKKPLTPPHTSLLLCLSLTRYRVLLP
jgi:hypothetical protein